MNFFSKFSLFILEGKTNLMMVDGRVVERENLKNFFDAITKIKKKKGDQYEEIAILTVWESLI